MQQEQTDTYTYFDHEEGEYLYVVTKNHKLPLIWEVNGSYHALIPRWRNPEGRPLNREFQWRCRPVITSAQATNRRLLQEALDRAVAEVHRVEGEREELRTKLSMATGLLEQYKDNQRACAASNAQLFSELRTAVRHAERAEAERDIARTELASAEEKLTSLSEAVDRLHKNNDALRRDLRAARLALGREIHETIAVDWDAIEASALNYIGAKAGRRSSTQPSIKECAREWTFRYSDGTQPSISECARNRMYCFSDGTPLSPVAYQARLDPNTWTRRWCA